MRVIEENCTLAGVDINRANNSLDKEKLNLNSKYLKKWRKEVIDVLASEIEREFLLTGDFEASVLMVASAHLDKNENYEPFFSTIRSYFDADAEMILLNNGYNG